MSESLPEVYLARHGETAWTISRQHTGRTDIPLTARGKPTPGAGRAAQGRDVRTRLRQPARRARRTCELAGFGARARLEADLLEWDYGAYEGRTTAEIRAERPGWDLFRDGCPGGESVEEVGARADRVVARLSRHADGSSSSATATSSASWPRVGWACHRRTRVSSGSAPRRSASSATSTPWTNRRSASGTTTATPCPDETGNLYAGLGRDRRI